MKAKKRKKKKTSFCVFSLFSKFALHLSQYSLSSYIAHYCIDRSNNLRCRLSCLSFSGDPRYRISIIEVSISRVVNGVQNYRQFSSLFTFKVHWTSKQRVGGFGLDLYLMMRTKQQRDFVLHFCLRFEGWKKVQGWMKSSSFQIVGFSPWENISVHKNVLTCS